MQIHGKQVRAISECTKHPSGKDRMIYIGRFVKRNKRAHSTPARAPKATGSTIRCKPWHSMRRIPGRLICNIRKLHRMILIWRCFKIFDKVDRNAFPLVITYYIMNLGDCIALICNFLEMSHWPLSILTSARISGHAIANIHMATNMIYFPRTSKHSEASPRSVEIPFPSRRQIVQLNDLCPSAQREALPKYHAAS
jgi:hypothetical protein